MDTPMTTTANLLDSARTKAFRNWAGSVRTTSTRWVQPRTIDEVSQLMRTLPSGTTVRPVGAGHSFTPIAAGDDVMVNLDHLSGIVNVDIVRKRVRFLAGTRIHEVPALLSPFGLAVPNQGDVDPQSLAGAINTSTHGTGLGFTGFAGTVTALTLIDAAGNRREYSVDNDPDMLKLVTVGVGALGIVVEVEMQCVEAFDLLAEESGDYFDDILDTFVERAEQADHFEVFWFPHTDRAQIKRNTRLQPGQEAPGGDPKPRNWFKRTFDDEIIGNGLYASALQLGRVVPSTVPVANRTATALLSNNRYRARAHEVFVHPRRVRFHEMEYAVPLADGPEAVREIRKVIDANDWKIAFPLELRVTAADDVALSTANGRESMYIALHTPQFYDPTEYFAATEPILRAAGGRPHWGKQHTLGYDELSTLYPRFDEFCAVRRELDPQGAFASPYMSKLFGI